MTQHGCLNRVRGFGNADSVAITDELRLANDMAKH